MTARRARRFCTRTLGLLAAGALVASAVAPAPATAAPSRAASATPATSADINLSITPSDIAIDTRDASLGIIGNGFVDGMTAKLRGFGAVVTGVEYIDPHVVRIDVRVDPDAHPGPRTLVLTNPGGRARRCRGCVAVVRQPTATGTVNAQVGQGAQGASFLVTGTGFDRFVSASVDDGVRVYSSGSAYPTSIFVIVDVAPNATPGTRDVTIRNFNYGHVICVACLTITPGPKFVAIDPASLDPGAQHVALTLTGTGFQAGMTVRITQAAVHVESVDITSPTSATVTVSVYGAAHPRTDNIGLTNPDGGTSKAVDAVSVT